MGEVLTLKEYYERALKIDPEDRLGYSVLSIAKFMREWDKARFRLLRHSG